jgi:hypothetical protein
MGTLRAKTSQWRPGHVPYLPYPRYATDPTFSKFLETLNLHMGITQWTIH